MANFHHNNRNHGHRGRGRKNQNVENRDNKELRENEENKERRENKDRYDQQEARAMYRERRERENRERDNQAITTFVLGEKELEGKNAQFQYDKGWYSITDIIGEEKNVVYKSKNAQEAYTKWNVYIGRKKERPQRAEKVEN